MTVELTAPGSGTEMVVTAQVKDPAGNESAVASDKATIATDDIGAPKVTITEDSRQQRLDQQDRTQWRHWRQRRTAGHRQGWR